MAAAAESHQSKVVHLQVVSGPDQGKMFFLKTKQEALVGRHPAADLRLTDPGSSGRHCLIQSVGDMAVVEDLESRNGTRIAGEPVTKRVLDETTRIEIGTSVIEVSWVATEREVPLGAVASAGAPTLVERSGQTTTLRRGEQEFGSTIVGMQQLKELRAAQARLGETLGEYMLVEVVGVGTMGFVYRAKQTKTRTELALKVMPRDSFRTEKLMERFLAGCRTDLAIAGAARILGTGLAEKDALVAMEFARGRNLQSLVDAGRTFPVNEAVTIAVAVCETLNAAHAAGVFHRDLKPANIVVQEEPPASPADLGAPAPVAGEAGVKGAPVLLDLGMGKKTDGEGKSLVRSERLEALSYCSPEVSREAAVDARADVYSLAATLYGVLTHERPFKADSRVELVRKIRWESPAPVTDLRSDVPPKLAGVIARAMEKEPERRYADAAAFGGALKDAVS
jgi:pSer/pThr/pTyr-binding forkhead associated (FHA) protein